jgi:predicted AlkP superfamily pyrophosphatase or phosphodiesterase
MSAPNPTAVILAVGLNESLMGDHTPNLQAFAKNGDLRHLKPDLPAVTTTVQSSMLTGVGPDVHGIVGNGWYNREMDEIQFWKQSNKLVQHPKVWETARQRDPSVTTLNMFWWYNMNTTADYAVTPRPIYKADGRKLPDCYANPDALRDELQEALGQFPLFNFWGPATSVKSSQWIADATVHVHKKVSPTLTFVYLPHLDYCLQKLGPGHVEIPKHVAELDGVIGQLLDYFQGAGVRPIIASEYGIEPVDDAVHVNRVVRDDGAIAVREEEGLEILDPGACDAFAVADHQIAHVYVKDPQRIAYYHDLCSRIDGVEQVLDRHAQQAQAINHDRAGDLVLISEPRRWFSYYYWQDDTKAPDFARCVEIHRKPGYDPVELFLDPTLPLPHAQIAWRLLKKKLGFRTLMNVIPLDASLVQGSHGRTEQDAKVAPVVITQGNTPEGDSPIPCRKVHDLILEQLFGA